MCKSNSKKFPSKSSFRYLNTIILQKKLAFSKCNYFNSVIENWIQFKVNKSLWFSFIFLFFNFVEKKVSFSSLKFFTIHVFANRDVAFVRQVNSFLMSKRINFFDIKISNLHYVLCHDIHK